jgi:Tol biopolymer transport system component
MRWATIPIIPASSRPFPGAAIASWGMPAPGPERPGRFEPRPGTSAVLSLFRPPVRALVLILLIVGGLGFGIAHYTSLAPTSTARAPMRTVRLTTSPGFKVDPALSGDGEQVAFVWDGNVANRTDVYVKRIGTDRPLQLTQSGGPVCCTAWTSDDRYVAFERCSVENAGIYLVPSLGGQERRIRKNMACNGLSLSPTEQHMVFSDKSSPGSPWALFLMSLDDLQARQLTFPTANIGGDHNPAFSPDGKLVAFTRIVGEGTTDVYTVPVSGGPARQLTFDKVQVYGTTWTADGKKIIFSSRRDGSQSLWVVPTAGGEPRRLALGSAEAFNPTISRRGDRLTYLQGDIHPNLWAVEISGSGGRESGRPQPFLSSAAYDNGPRFSPDGKKIAFASNRSGDFEIWTCDVADCSEPQQLTFLKASSGTARWSPDGTRIAFDSRPHGHSQILVVSAEGGKALPVTEGTAEDKVPSWSSDGAFLYFSSNRNGASQIWKVPANGGQPMQVTQHGGLAAFESSDGRFLYCVKENQNGVWRMPTSGGEEVRILARPSPENWGNWALFDRGIYFVDETGPRPAIEFLAFATNKASKVAEVESLPPPGDRGFTVSPDEKRILFSQVERSPVDIMLVENFRDGP